MKQKKEIREIIHRIVNGEDHATYRMNYGKEVVIVTLKSYRADRKEDRT